MNHQGGKMMKQLNDQLAGTPLAQTIKKYGNDKPWLDDRIKAIDISRQNEDPIRPAGVSQE